MESPAGAADLQECVLAQIIPILLFLVVLAALNKLQTGRLD